MEALDREGFANVCSLLIVTTALIQLAVTIAVQIVDVGTTILRKQMYKVSNGTVVPISCQYNPCRQLKRFVHNMQCKRFDIADSTPIWGGRWF